MRKCYVVLSMVLLSCAILVVNAQAQITRVGTSFDADSPAGKWKALGVDREANWSAPPSVGDWLSWDINIPADGIYTVELKLQKAVAGCVAVTVDGALIGEVDTSRLPDAEDGHPVTEVGGVGLSAGPHTFKVEVIALLTPPYPGGWAFPSPNCSVEWIRVTPGITITYPAQAGFVGTPAAQWGAYNVVGHVNGIGNHFSGVPSVGGTVTWNISVPIDGIYTVEVTMENDGFNSSDIQMAVDGAVFGFVDVSTFPSPGYCRAEVGDVELSAGTHTFQVKTVDNPGYCKLDTIFISTKRELRNGKLPDG